MRATNARSGASCTASATPPKSSAQQSDQRVGAQRDHGDGRRDPARPQRDAAARPARQAASASTGNAR